MSTQLVTRIQLRNILNALANEPTDVSIVTRTEPTMRKTGNPFVGNVRKISTVHGVINWHYATEVNKQRNREQSFTVVNGMPQINEVEVFEAQPRKWGVRLENSPFVEHREKFYLEVKVNDTQTPQYVDNNDKPIVGEELDQLKSFFPVKKEGARQQVEKPVIVRDYDFDNVVALTTHDNKTTFVVIS